MTPFRPADSESESDAQTDVRRPRAEAARTYDRLSRFYDLTEGFFERRHQDIGLGELATQPGEQILEIGYGTGRCLVAVARSVGPWGKVAGIDISAGMCEVTRKRLRRKGLSDRVDLRVGDAVQSALRGRFLRRHLQQLLLGALRSG